MEIRELLERNKGIITKVINEIPQMRENGIFIETAHVVNQGETGWGVVLSTRDKRIILNSISNDVISHELSNYFGNGVTWEVYAHPLGGFVRSVFPE